MDRPECFLVQNTRQLDGNLESFSVFLYQFKYQSKLPARLGNRFNVITGNDEQLADLSCSQIIKCIIYVY